MWETVIIASFLPFVMKTRPMFAKRILLITSRTSAGSVKSVGSVQLRRAGSA